MSSLSLVSLAEVCHARGFVRAALGAALQERELSITSLTCLPLGAGSHHCLARDVVGNRWFVTVDVLEWKLCGMFGPTFDPWVIPFGESARRLLGDNESLIRELRDRCGELADEVRDAGEASSWGRR